ncbi:Transposase DDE domain protein [compost metagenome]
MHQTKKGNQWHFGMKAHIGVDAKSGLTHSLATTAANEHDLNQAGNLLHGKEEFVFGDAGYQGAPKREELAGVKVEWAIAERPGKVKARYKGLMKNDNQLAMLFTLANLFRVDQLIRAQERST